MIIVKLMGGLGNQMFQYASAFALSMRHGAPLRLDHSFLEDRSPREKFTYRSYALDAFGIINRLETSELKTSGPIVHYQEPSFSYDANFAKLPAHCYLEGYFQSEKYFLGQAQAIRKAFGTPPTLNSYSLHILERIKGSSQPVALHIRRGDYVTTHSQTHPVCSLDYYYSALSCMRQKLGNFELFIFSDDPDWANTALQLSGITTSLVDSRLGSGDCGDLYLMSQCRHHITANSSFSWWGAWLGAHADQNVIAPRRWFASNEMNEATFDLCPSHWIRLGDKIPEMSVLMPVRNGEIHLAEAVESILSQSFPDFELLAIDDASTDSTPSILEHYRRKDMRLRVLRNEEWKTIAPSLNSGLSQAIAPLIVRMDADDFAEPRRLEIQHSYMVEHPEVSVCGSYYRFYSNGSLQEVPTEDSSIRREMLFRNPMGHPTVIMRRDLLMRLGGYDLNAPFTEDYALWAKLSQERNVVFANIPHPLLRYRYDFSRSPELDAKRLRVQKAANRIAQKLRNLQPSESLLGHARWCLAHQQPDRTQLLAQLVYEREPNSPDALAILAESLWYQGRKEEALSHLSSLIGQHPDFKPGILLAMAITNRLGEKALSDRIGAAYARRHPEDSTFKASLNTDC